MSAVAVGAAAGFPRLDKYELLEEIGHGGMATVYRAMDPRLGREVAVKVIHRHLRDNAEVGTRFVAEARAAAKLRHAGIVEVFDVSNEDDPERYLVAELLRGTTLRKVLLGHRDMPAEVGAAIVRHLCFAVEHAHASSIIHRDIKPENVLVELPQDRVACTPSEDAPRTPLTPRVRSVSTGPTSDQCSSASSDNPLERSGETQASTADGVTPHGMRARQGKPSSHRDRGPPKARLVDPGVVIKITDFGIAKILDAQGVTSTGQVLGSPAHMAPEQIEGGDVDPRTDVFALGVLLYECLVGHLPFEGKNPAQVLRRVLDGAYPPPDRERPSVGGRWASIVAAALAHDPAERLGSASQLGDRIQAELDALGVPDGRAEICAYFADPAAYVEAHTAALVPRLTARGEAARKGGDVWGAAADWNRALALAPDDLAILKRIAGLTSSAGRRILIRRAAMILAGSAALGLGAFAVARTLKSRATLHEPGPVTTTELPDGAALPPRADGTATAAPEPLLRHAPVASAVVSTGPVDTAARVPRTPATPGFALSPPPPPAAGVRGVRFTIKPSGARLAVDGAERTWFGQVIQLSVGPHAIEATPTDLHCCKRTAGSLNVLAPPADKPDDVQVLVFPMELNPAGVSLAAGAPKGAQLYCSDIGLNVPTGKTVLAKLRDTEWEGSCSFVAPERPPRMSKLKLKAGESKTVPWPD